MSYAIVRFSHVQRLRPFEVNEDSIHGTLLNSKKKKTHGQNWPWACPRKGITSSYDWSQLLLDMRDAYYKTDAHHMKYSFPRLSHNWKLVADGPASYSTTRRKLAPL